MDVVIGATGQTGSVVARTLLAEKRAVRVLVRDAARGVEWQKLGADVAVAPLADAAAVARAFEGADGAYVMVPPDYGAPSLLAVQKQVVDTLAAAPRPKYTVLLSSWGAELPSGTGPIATLSYAEKRLEPEASLRAGYFQENWANGFGPVREQGTLYSALTPNRKQAMVATEDVGRTAAELIIEKRRGIVELAGPEDYSPNDVAAALSKILGREIQTVAVPEEGVVPALIQAGLTPDLAELFRQMNVALNQGRITWKGTPLRGRISLEATLRKLLK